MRAATLIAVLAVQISGAAADPQQKKDETTVEVVKPPPPPPPKPDQPVPPPGDPFDVFPGGNPSARDAFLAARQASKEGRTADACRAYADSWGQEEVITTLFYLATCRETDGKNAEAWRMYQEVATKSDQDHNADRAKLARDRAAGLEDKLGTLVIRFGKPIMDGTVVNIDGRPLAMASEIRDKVDPGEVLVTAKGPTGVTSSRMVKVTLRNVVYVEVPSLRDQGSYRRRTWMVASGVLLLGGVIAIGTRNGYAALAGAGAIAGGIAVFLLAPRDRVMVVPMTVGTSGGGVALVGRF